MLTSKELGRCKQFLLENGWNKDRDDEDAGDFNRYYKEGSIGVDISDKGIVLVCDIGDFLHLHLSYYALVGALIEYHQIGFNYTSTRKDYNDGEQECL